MLVLGCNSNSLNRAKTRAHQSPSHTLDCNPFALILASDFDGSPRPLLAPSCHSSFLQCTHPCKSKDRSTASIQSWRMFLHFAPLPCPQKHVHHRPHQRMQRLTQPEPSGFSASALLRLGLDIRPTESTVHVTILQLLTTLWQICLLLFFCHPPPIPWTSPAPAHLPRALPSCPPPQLPPPAGKTSHRRRRASNMFRLWTSSPPLPF